MKAVVFSGTTEGRRFSKKLAALGAEVTVCVATPLGAEVQGGMAGITVHAGRLGPDAMAALLTGVPANNYYLNLSLFLAIVFHCGLDGVFRKNGTVDFDGRKLKFFGNCRIFELFGFFQGLALDQFGDQRAGSDGTGAAVGFELSVFDHAVVVDLDLQA